MAVQRDLRVASSAADQLPQDHLRPSWNWIRGATGQEEDPQR